MSDWYDIKMIFIEALGVEMPQRHMFVLEQSRGNAFVFKEVMSLLEHHDPDFQLPIPGGGFIFESPKINQTIDNYTIISHIGNGAFGDVYKARNQWSEDWAAIKFLKSGCHEGNAYQMFVEEMKTHAKMDHGGLAKIKNAGQWEDQLYIIMDYVDGLSLEAYCKGKTIRQKVILFQQICETVGHIHSKQYIHRDIKPSNIMVTHCGRSKVLDLGIATPGVDALGEANPAPAGTPPYMAPEQLFGGKVSYASDVYALGVSFYKILTGRWPYQGMEDGDLGISTMRRILQEGNPASIMAHLPGLDRRLAAIIDRCLQRGPENRYANAQALAQAFQRYLKPSTAKFVALPVILGCIALATILMMYLVKSQAVEDQEWCSRAEMVWVRDPGGTEQALATFRAEFDQELAVFEAEVDARWFAKGSGYLALGRVHTAMGDYERALHFLNRAGAWGDHSTRQRYALARCKLEDFWQVLEANHLNFRDAEADPLGPNHLDSLREVSQLLESDGDWRWLDRDCLVALRHYLEVLLRVNGNPSMADLAPVLARLEGLNINFPGKDVMIGRIYDAQLRNLLAHRGAQEDIHHAFEHALAAYQRADRYPSRGRVDIKIKQANLYRLGGMQFENQQEAYFDKALSLCREALLIDPGNVEANLVTAEVYISRGYAASDEVKAQNWRAACEFMGIYSQNRHHLRRAGTLYLVAATRFKEARLLRRAEDYMNRALQATKALAKPGDPELYLALGRVNRELAKWENDAAFRLRCAADFLTRGLAKYPNHARLHHTLGYVYRDMARNGEGQSRMASAVAHFRRANELSDRWMISYALGSALRIQAGMAASGTNAEQLYGEAQSFFQDALRRDPFAKKNKRNIFVGLAATHVSLGRLAWERGRSFVPYFREAQKILRAAEAETGDPAFLLFWQANLVDQWAELSALSGGAVAEPPPGVDIDLGRFHVNNPYYLSLAELHLEALIKRADMMGAEAGLDLISQAETLVSGLSGRLSEGDLSWYRARLSIARGGLLANQGLLIDAAEAFDQSRRLLAASLADPRLEGERVLKTVTALYHLCAWIQRTGDSCLEPVTAGLAMLDAHETDRDFSRFAYHRGRLLWLLSLDDCTPGRRRLQREADAHFQAAVRKNRHLIQPLGASPWTWEQFAYGAVR